MLTLERPASFLVSNVDIQQNILHRQLAKALPIERDSFTHFISAFPSLLFEKIKVGVFDDSQIWQLFKDEHFIETMSKIQKNVWLPFKNIVSEVLGYTRAQNYTEIVH